MQETCLEELIFARIQVNICEDFVLTYVFTPSQICICTFTPSLSMDTVAVFREPLMPIHKNHFGELISEQIHAAPVFAPGRIQENILGELFMYWFRARG